MTTKRQRLEQAQQLNEKTLHIVFTTGEEVTTPHVFMVYENYENGTLEVYMNPKKMINALIYYNLENTKDWKYI